MQISDITAEENIGNNGGVFAIKDSCNVNDSLAQSIISNLQLLNNTAKSSGGAIYM